MILHFVLFTLNEGLSAEDPRVTAALKCSRGLAVIPLVRNWRAGPNLSHRAIAADFAALGEFDNLQDLDAFLRHPMHVAAGQHWTELATLSIADIEVPDPGAAPAQFKR